MTHNLYARGDLASALHGAARLHVHLARMDGLAVTTRGWTYNELVDGVMALSCDQSTAAHQHRCLETLFDTLDGIQEIGPNAVHHLADLRSMT